MQPRRYFDPDTLAELADSIRQYGILQPISVRKKGREYELIAGERRLRAARMAGLEVVPCLLCDADMFESSILALVENLQRHDLDYIDEAEGILRLIKTYGLTQEEAAKKLGKSQSAVANKLRLLKLSPEILYILRESSLSERHARALLRLRSNEERTEVLSRIVNNHLTVAETDALVEVMLCEPPEPQPAPAPMDKPARRSGERFIVVKDLRIFINTISHGLEMLKRSGLAAEYSQDEDAAATTLTIRIPKPRR
jgi:ParB family chromosome partitioning protein